jgi:DNA-binding response OmpR family regulator
MAKLRILFVEEDDASYLALATYINYLSHYAFGIEREKRVNHELTNIMGNPPDLFIIEAMLGKDSRAGIELAKTLRTDHRTERVPIIVTSSTAETSVLREAGEIVDFCFDKADKPSLLLAAIRHLVGDGEPEPRPDQNSSKPQGAD